MKFTAQEEYGLRCIMQVARTSGDIPITIPEIAKNEGVSLPYVGKLMTTLRQAGLVKSVRGRKGGYFLSRPNDQISAADVMKVLGQQLFDEQFCDRWTGEMKICVHSPDCTIRSLWTGLERTIYQTLDRIKLSDLVGTEQEAANTIDAQWAVSTKS